MDLYFERHDGQAVTCDDFRAAMADANGADLAQFERWYTQSGTPTVTAVKVYDPAAKTLSLTLAQTCVAPPGESAAAPLPFHMPVRVGFLGKDSAGRAVQVHAEEVLELREASQTFVIADVAAEPVLSLFRGFSAPVKVELCVCHVKCVCVCVCVCV